MILNTDMNSYIETVKHYAEVSKYTTIYIAICDRAKQRCNIYADAKKLFGYVEKHHILPQSFKLGGNKDRENIVFLNAKEHYICHRLLTKMFNNHFKFKMIKALFMMSTTRKEKRYLPNSRVYELIRIQNSKVISKHNKEIGLKPPSAIGRIVSSETRKKLSELQQGNTHWLGKNHTEESKKKIRETKKNKPWVPPVEKGIKHSADMKGNIPWNKGKKTGQKVWNKGLVGIMIPWNKGIKQYWIYNPQTKIAKTVVVEDLEKYLALGFRRGRK